VKLNGQRRTAIVISVLALLLAIGAAIRLSGGDDSGGDDAVLPSVELTAAGDLTLSTDDLVGEPLVINFWYSACPPCANELQDFAAVHTSYGDRVRFVGVNAIDSIDKMSAFAGERGVTYELYQDRLAELQTELRLTSFPTTLFVAADGSIVERTGVLDESRLETEVIELLAAES
jgi:thiol-disulfide isomerase/thioredoxin